MKEEKKKVSRKYQYMLAIEIDGEMFYGRMHSTKKGSKQSCVNRALPVSL